MGWKDLLLLAQAEETQDKAMERTNDRDIPGQTNSLQFMVDGKSMGIQGPVLCPGSEQEGEGEIRNGTLHTILIRIVI